MDRGQGGSSAQPHPEGARVDIEYGTTLRLGFNGLLSDLAGSFMVNSALSAKLSEGVFVQMGDEIMKVVRLEGNNVTVSAFCTLIMHARVNTKRDSDEEKLVHSCTGSEGAS